MKSVSVYNIYLTIYLFSSTNQTYLLKIWQGTKIWKDKSIFHDMENFLEYGRPDIKTWKIHVQIQDKEIFQDMESFQDMEIFQDIEIILDKEIILDIKAKHNTLLHCTTIGRRKHIYRHAYNLYAYVLH